MINVATALNRKYLLYTVVMLTSLCENNASEESIRALILHHELKQEDFDLLHECLKDYDIEIEPLYIQPEIISDRLPRNIMWSVEMYYRLLLMDRLPEEIDRILYLDVDIIVNKDIRGFYHSDFEGKNLIVCDNTGGDVDTYRDHNPKKLEMLGKYFEMGFKYFNSGVLLMNIQSLRKEYSFDNYVEAFEVWNYEMAAPDQDILNWVHWDQVKYADARKYDCFAGLAHKSGFSYEHVKENSYIIHFTGDKPWETKKFHHPIEMIWWDYAKMTPCYQQLIDGFFEKTFFQTDAENYIREILDNEERCTQKLGEAIQLNQRLLDMIRGVQS